MHPITKRWRELVERLRVQIPKGFHIEQVAAMIAVHEGWYDESLCN